MIGVTGSKGKSTTATLIHKTLEAASIPTVLAGNIGRSALDLVEEAVSNRPVVVLEMSSYQTHDLTLGPPVAVITRLVPRAPRLARGVEAYYDAKLRIASTQRDDDVTIWNGTDLEIAKRVPLGPARHVAYGLAAVSLLGGCDEAPRPAQSPERGRCAHRRGALRCQAIASGKRAGLLHRAARTASRTSAFTAACAGSTTRSRPRPRRPLPRSTHSGGEVAAYIGGGTDRGFDFSAPGCARSRRARCAT